MADSLQVIRDAVDEMKNTITAELDELAQQPVITPEAVQAIADNIREQSQRIKDMVPAPPVP
jgi:hypothetical protein